MRMPSRISLRVGGAPWSVIAWSLLSFVSLQRPVGRSSGEPAAVDEQDRAGHVGGVVAHEEQARLRLLLGRREAAEWVAADELGLGALRVRLRGDPV